MSEFGLFVLSASALGGLSLGKWYFKRGANAASASASAGPSAKSRTPIAPLPSWESVQTDHECECMYGFERPDFLTRDGDLLGSIDDFKKHVIICTGQLDWPRIITEPDGLAKTFHNYIKSLKDKMPDRVKISACNQISENPNGEGMDVIIFPDLVKYKNVTEKDVAALVDSQLVAGTRFGGLESEPIDGDWVFVCTHNERDRRCGVCGPRLLLEFDKALKSEQFSHLAERIKIRAISHIGGHKFAGNVLIYTTNPTNNKCLGDLYGYVNITDIPRLINDHIVNNEVQKKLWRGRVGVRKELQEKFSRFV